MNPSSSQVASFPSLAQPVFPRLGDKPRPQGPNTKHEFSRAETPWCDIHMEQIFHINDLPPREPNSLAKNLYRVYENLDYDENFNC